MREEILKKIEELKRLNAEVAETIEKANKTLEQSKAWRYAKNIKFDWEK